jgi:Tfp pilus assembly protein PilN
MRAVNLLPRDLPKRRGKTNVPAITGAITLVLDTTVLCAGFLLENAKVAHNRSQLDAARAELALIPPPPPRKESATALAGEQTQRVAALQGALTGRVQWDRVLREISLVLPADVWLNRLTLHSPGSVDGGTSSAFAMNGKAYSHEGVARLLSRLSLVPDLENVTLDHSARINPGKHGPVEFSVIADLRAPGATS